jgi:hypothetical protein
MKKLDAHTIRAIAVRSHRDPRTVQSVLNGGGSSVAIQSVNEAIDRLGLRSRVEGVLTVSRGADEDPS